MGAYKRIFFDITNHDLDLEEISKKVKSFYKTYMDFFILPIGDVEECLEQYYFFSMLVRPEHADCIASGLHDFLSHELSEKIKK